MVRFEGTDCGEEAVSTIFPGVPKETVLKYRVNPTYPEEEFKPSEVTSETWESLPKFRRAALALAVVEHLRISRTDVEGDA